MLYILPADQNNAQQVCDFSIFDAHSKHYKNRKKSATWWKMEKPCVVIYISNTHHCIYRTQNTQCTTIFCISSLQNTLMLHVFISYHTLHYWGDRSSTHSSRLSLFWSSWAERLLHHLMDDHCPRHICLQLDASFWGLAFPPPAEHQHHYRTPPGRVNG